MSRILRCASVLLVGLGAALLTTCSSSSGGGALNEAPRVVAVSFLGAGANPVAGDRLRITMSEAITVTADIPTDAAFTISGGGTLGTVNTAATVVSSVIVEITLGSGVNLTAGTTTLDFSDANRFVRDSTGRLALPAAAKTLTKGDAEVPTITSLTIGDIDSILNGSGPAGGTLQAATTGFTIDVTFNDSSAIDTAASLVTADRAVVANGTSIDQGQSLTAQLTASASSGKVTYTVPNTVRFPDGPFTLTVRLVDVTGQVSSPSSFSFTTRTLGNDRLLFENGQVWFLDTSRDLESFTVNLGSGSLPITVVAGANGRSDYDDILRILGLHSATPLANVSGSKDSNVVVTELLQARMLEDLGEYFTGTKVTFTFTSPGTFPNTTTGVVPYGSHNFSQMCIAGAHQTSGTTGVLGLAILDDHNQNHEDDCSVDFGGARLGVFLHTLVNNGFQFSSSHEFRTTYDPFTPARSGQPIGAAGDAAHLQNLLNNTRTTNARFLQIEKAINDYARFTALVVAHECGHSMGMVINGAMPTGLYGGDGTNFPSSQSGHIAMPDSIFPGNAINIMTPAISYLGGKDAGSKFNTLNLAYLREQVTYN